MPDKRLSPDITAADIADGTLEQWIETQQASVLVLRPGKKYQDTNLTEVQVIIATGSLESLQPQSQDLQTNLLPPILYLTETEQLPSGCDVFIRDHLIDILPLPVSQVLLLHHIEMLARIEKLQNQNHSYSTSVIRQLDILSQRDGLTGLLNRSTFISQLQTELSQAAASGEDITICLLNIDYFNRFNQRHGREYGDMMLNELAARLTQITGSEATCYRFTGEDFAVLIPSASPQQTLALAEKMSECCKTEPFLDGPHAQTITMSIGMASLIQHQPQDVNQFLNMAETALYIAKAEGRNRIKQYPVNAHTGEYQNEHSQLFIRRTLENFLEKTRNATISSLKLLAHNVAGPELRNQIQRVSTYMKLLGTKLGLPDTHLQTFENAAALHACFKMLLHSNLVTKPAQLEPNERQQMDDLPLKLTELIETFDYFANERYILETHTERYDGTGRPYGLRADEIPLGARIFNVVNSVIAMSSNRPYRRRLSGADILQELRNGAGKQFDPLLVMQMLAVIEEDNLLNIDQESLKIIKNELITEFPELQP